MDGFDKAIKNQSPFVTVLKGGLHMRLSSQEGKRAILLWRNGGIIPSETECLTVAKHAGFAQRQIRRWSCTESNNAYLIVETEPLLIAERK